MAAVAIGIFLATVDGSIVNLAMPTLEKALSTDFAMVQWVVLAYLLVITTLTLSMGRLGDMLGKKGIYLTGFIIFTLGSLLCGISPNIELLILSRIFQGVGASMIMALGAAIVTEAFPPYERGRSMGLIGTIVSIGVVTGPVLGGLILARFTWHWIFFVNLPVGIVGIGMVMRHVPDIKPVRGQKFDFPGAIFFFVSLLALLVGLTMGQRMGFFHPYMISLYVIWFVFLVLFLVVEMRVKHPMLDLHIFQNGHLSINVITGFMSFLSAAGVFVLMPFYLENILHQDKGSMGLLMSVVPIMLGIVSPRAGRLSDKWGTRPLTNLGLIILSLGFLGVSTLQADTSPLGYALRFIPVGIGMGLFHSPNNSAIMGSVPRHQLGIASGLLSITRTLGQTVGVAVLGALWASRVLGLSGSGATTSPTGASVIAQVEGLQFTFLVVASIIGLAWLLSLWGLQRNRRSRRPVSSTASE